MWKSKNEFYQIITGVFVGCLLISNILASRTFEVASIVLPSAVIVFPVVYIVNDVLAEVYGYHKAKNVIYLGFVMNVFAVVVYNIVMALPSPEYAVDIAAAFDAVLSNTLRMLIASLAAYIVGSLMNAKVMVVLKNNNDERLMFRCMLSTLIGEGLDALIFITIAFCGTMPAFTLATMVVAQATFKTCFEFVMFPVTKRVIKKVKALQE